MAKSVALSIIIAVIVLSRIAFAVPWIPNRFYGYVNFIDGPAPDGSTVDVKVDGTIVASTATHNGTYGYAPNVFDVTDPDNSRAGKTITFFVNSVNTGETATFMNGKSTVLDLSVNSYINNPTPSDKIEDIVSSNEYTNNSPANSASTAPLSNEVKKDTTCTPDWVCSDWASCSNKVQTKTCIDANNCTKPTSNIVLTQNCTEHTISQEKTTTAPDSSTIIGKEEVKQQTPTGHSLSITSNSITIAIVMLSIVVMGWYLRRK